MDRISTLPSYAVVGKERRGHFSAELREEKSGQVLAVTHDEALVAYQLDDNGRPEGEKMADGVILGRLKQRSIVCFVELKTTLKAKEGEDRVERALLQVQAAVEHFHPVGRSGGTRNHGDDHHDEWASGSDPIAVVPEPEHEVIALVVTFRSLPRRAPEAPRKLGNKTIYRAVVQVSPAVMNRAATTFGELLRLAGRP